METEQATEDAVTPLATLKHTRLAKLQVECFMDPKTAPRGTIDVAIKSVLTKKENPLWPIVKVSMTVTGEHEEDGKMQRAFAGKCTMEGVFNLNREVDEALYESQAFVNSLAAYILPIVADTLDMMIGRLGYPGLLLPRNVSTKELVTKKKRRPSSKKSLIDEKTAKTVNKAGAAASAG